MRVWGMSMHVLDVVCFWERAWGSRKREDFMAVADEETMESFLRQALFNL